MVVLTDKKDKSTTGFLMTLIPDKAYLESTHFDALRSNYKQWQKGFSGYVFYHTLDGKFNNAWRFANGKVIKKVTQNSGKDLNLNMGTKKKVTAETVCTDYYYEVYSADCMDWTVNGEYTTTTCADGFYFDGYQYAYTVCTYTDTNKLTGGYDGGGNGGGTYYDCNGDANGSAYYDECQICVGGNSQKTPCVRDCNNVLNGTAYVDSCQVCVGGDTGKTACTECEQLDNELAALFNETSELWAVRQNVISVSNGPCCNDGYIKRIGGSPVLWESIADGYIYGLGNVTKMSFSHNAAIIYLQNQENIASNISNFGLDIFPGASVWASYGIGKLVEKLIIAKGLANACTAVIAAWQFKFTAQSGLYKKMRENFDVNYSNKGLYIIDTTYSDPLDGIYSAHVVEFYSSDGCYLGRILY